jgi:hypothetical protein
MKTPSSGIFFALLVVIAMQGCGLFSSSPSSGPRPALSVVQATDLGPIPTNPDILGRDGGYSALFQGYSVWLYGDTFLAKPNYEDRTLLSDTWSFTTDLNAQDGITGFHEPLDSVGAPTMILPDSRRASVQPSPQRHELPNTALRRSLGVVAVRNRRQPRRQHGFDLLYGGQGTARKF